MSETLTEVEKCRDGVEFDTLDSAILESLPPGLRVVSIKKHGKSSWSDPMHVVCETAGGEQKDFFLKQVNGAHGKVQLEGEFTGMSGLHRLMPNFTPKPYAWGQLRDRKAAVPVYFILLEYIEFIPGQLPNRDVLAQRVAELHRRSISPTGCFGYHLTTYDGGKTQSVKWDASWPSFFTTLLDTAHGHDVSANGRSAELEPLLTRTRTHLIPRLLGALGEIEPVLIHGDMWEGNIGVSRRTLEPYVFDCAAYYAHHEMEMGVWYAERHELSRGGYVKAYLELVETSEPKAECHDRIRLYSTKTNLMFSACSGQRDVRRLIYNDLSYLIDKYVPAEADETSSLKTDTNSLSPSSKELASSDVSKPMSRHLICGAKGLHRVAGWG